jgi:RNA polymerase sigma-70 factor (ECF subfamily)
MIGSYASELKALSAPVNVPEADPCDIARLPEREIIRRAQLGDASAFECIYRMHCGRVYALCLRMLGNRAEAEDLAQETFLTVLRKIRTFRGDSALFTWLHRIAVNAVLMRLRRKFHQQSSPNEIEERNGHPGELGEKLSAPDLLLAGSIDRLHLQKAFERLAPCQKMVVDLHDIQGYKHHEIAKIMDWSIGTSKTQLHRARRKLRELLQDSLPMRWVTPVREARLSPAGS